ncbi:hypothetical protein D3C87_1451370 [compost metagenome]
MIVGDEGGVAVQPSCCAVETDILDVPPQAIGGVEGELIGQRPLIRQAVVRARPDLEGLRLHHPVLDIVVLADRRPIQHQAGAVLDQAGRVDHR